MNIQLIQGEFNSQDALELITQMIHIKIKYHEQKIAKNSNEEDMKYRETKIKRLQRELFEFRNRIAEKRDSLKIDSIINIEIQ